MSKRSLFSQVLQMRISTYVLTGLAIITVCRFFSIYGIYNCSRMSLEDINNGLFKAVSPKLVKNKQGDRKICNYEHILHSKQNINSREVLRKYDKLSVRGLADGSFIPEDCNPVFSVAVVVTYRNRQSQFDIFLPYMHNFLRKQNIHYRIYLIEQQDEKPFNRGMLFNIGAKYAIADEFPCLVLHDVDLLPLDLSNLYVCMNQPRHMSSNVDRFRYLLKYDLLFGGVVAIKSEQYVAINGFSNKFKGWGGEDDDFAWRLLENDFKIVRFPPEIARYTMLHHKREPMNPERMAILKENRQQQNKEGYNSVQYEAIVLRSNQLFTLIGVKL